MTDAPIELVSERAEERVLSGIDYHDVPEPEIEATEIDIGDPRLPGGAKQVIKLARENGWVTRTTYSRGPWLHAAGDRYTDICDLVRVRILDVEARRLLSATWRRSATGEDPKWKLEACWDWTAHTEDAHINSDTLKAKVRRELP